MFNWYTSNEKNYSLFFSSKHIEKICFRAIGMVPKFFATVCSVVCQHTVISLFGLYRYDDAHLWPHPPGCNRPSRRESNETRLQPGVHSLFKSSAQV